MLILNGDEMANSRAGGLSWLLFVAFLVIALLVITLFFATVALGRRCLGRQSEGGNAAREDGGGKQGVEHRA